MDYEVARARMVKEQLIRRGIVNERVLKAMGSVPRHLFVDEAFWPRAYYDHPLPIGFDQTISQPYIVALMTHELEVQENGKILEIGTGSGYQAAILALLCSSVYTIERFDDLSKRAKKIITKLGISNISFSVGDGSVGLEKHAPFDGIIVTAGAPEISDYLMKQLAPGGKMVIPVGTMHYQRLIKIIKGENILEKHDICDCTFVPLIGNQAWNHE